MFIRYGRSHKENNYLEYITKDTNNEIHNEINECFYIFLVLVYFYVLY